MFSNNMIPKAKKHLRRCKISLSGDNDVGDDWRFVPPVPLVKMSRRGDDKIVTLPS